MLVVTRFRIDPAEESSFREGIELAHRTLAAQRGYVDGTLGRNLDEPDLWVLATRWEGVGAYRRALSSYDAKLHAWPALTKALDEASAYEVVEAGTDLNQHSSRSLG